eukprot:531220-Amphidinium_carterae.1
MTQQLLTRRYHLVQREYKKEPLMVPASRGALPYPVFLAPGAKKPAGLAFRGIAEKQRDAQLSDHSDAVQAEKLL